MSRVRLTSATALSVPTHSYTVCPATVCLVPSSTSSDATSKKPSAVRRNCGALEVTSPRNVESFAGTAYTVTLLAILPSLVSAFPVLVVTPEKSRPEPKP